jgi:hypothetical protein
MVEKINTQNTWRQIRSTVKAKKVKQRKDKNKDKSFQKDLLEEENKKEEQKEQKNNNHLKSEPSTKKFKVTVKEGSKKQDPPETSAQSGNSQGKLIDIVV